MKKLKGRIKHLNIRVRDRINGVIAISFVIKDSRFSGDFCLDDWLENGDLLEITYQKIGFFNKLNTIRTIAKNSDENSIIAKLKNFIGAVLNFIIGLFAFWFIAFSLYTYMTDADKIDAFAILLNIFFFIIGKNMLTSLALRLTILYHFLKK